MNDLRPAFLRIFWGLLFVGIDITIKDVDLITPDVIGYVLITIGAVELAKVNPQFARVRPLALCATLLWLLGMFRLPTVPPQPVSIAAAVCDVALAWFLCTGILQLATEQANRPLAQFAARSRTFVVAALLLPLAVVAIALVSAPTGLALAIPLLIVVFVGWMSVLMLIWRASSELRS